MRGHVIRVWTLQDNTYGVNVLAKTHMQMNLANQHVTFPVSSIERQHGLVVKAESTHPGGLASIPGALCW